MNDSTPDEAPNPTNVLIDRARIRGASRMIAKGTEAGAVTPEQFAQVGQDLDLFCRNNDISRKSVATALGYSAGVISEFIKGTYQGSMGQVAIDVEDWLIEEEQRRENQQKTQFVWTNVAKHIQSVAAYCIDMKKIGLVYGPETSGLGKTTALQAIHQEMGPRRSTLITIDKCDANPTGLLKKLISGLRLENTGSNAQKMQRIIETLSGRSHLLLIDQIHNLRFSKEDKPFYYLTDLYDATQTAQLWAGTSDMVAYLQRQQARTTDEPLAQIRRRIFPCVDLMQSLGDGGGGDPLYTVEDIRVMFSRFQLKLTTAGARWLTALARVPGSGALGTCVNIVEYAVMIGKARRLPSIDVPLLKEALRSGLTTERSDWAIKETEQLVLTDRSLRVA